jgi:hypothetical protein
VKILHGTKGELPLDVVVCENRTLEDVLFSLLVIHYILAEPFHYLNTSKQKLL